MEKRCQQEMYPNELEILTRKKVIRPTSNLLPRNPFLVDEGVLYLAVRLSRAQLPYYVLHPPIIPGRDPIAQMVIRAFHESIHHMGTEFVLANVRQHF
jgi:hypothetical protein